MTFKLTYSTMFNPPEEMHERFESALAQVRAKLGAFHAMYIDGKDVRGTRTRPTVGPVDQRVRLGEVAVGNAADVDRAVAAARQAFDTWRRTPAAERLALVRRVADLIEERVYTIGAAIALEVGKNRMEALGEVQETATFFSGYAAEFERSGGYDHPLPDDPLDGWASHNRSVLKPHGVWAVIAPFNYPMALAGGPTAAALVTGNTVVLKGASDTPWAGRLLAECIRDAGVPPGVFNYVIGSGAVVGDALIRHPDVAGATFTGSFDVGMGLLRSFATGRWPRPCITELGGKNPCIVTAHGDLERASTGIVRSAYGMSGQKCSALSRVYVDQSVAGELLDRIVAQIQALTVGDPTCRRIYMGPVISRRATAAFDDYCRRLRVGDTRILVGGARLSDGDLAHGHFVAPTLAEAPASHALFEEEMFVPILMVSRVRDFEEGLRLANATNLGLTAGCYGSEEEVRAFLDRIEAGVTYVNRPQGATTGAWPGYQAFGGWKGSGSTGKAIGSFYYLPQYLREQSQTWVEWRMPLMTLQEAIAAHVKDGQTLALEGFTHLIPFAAGHEIIRQGRADLHLVRMTPDIIYDQMIGAGCARELTFSWGGNPGVGSLHRLRDAVEHEWPRPLRIVEHSHAGMAAAYTAGASNLPFGILRGYRGTDLPHVNPQVKSVTCPYTGEVLATVPAIRPDVTIIHAQRADCSSNVLLGGILGVQKEAAMAAKRLIVTVEEVVESLDAPMNAVVLPGWIVSAIACVPGGAYPSYAQGYYARDNAFYLAWDEVSRDRDRFRRWIDQHVLGVADHAAFLRGVGVPSTRDAAGPAEVSA